MTTDRPTASVTGTADWEWNRWREAVRSRPAPERGGDPESSTRATDPTREPARTRPAERLEGDRERRIRELETELERTRERLQAVVDQYERRLAEKNRRLADRQAGHPNDGDGSVLATLRRFLARR